MLFFSLLIHMGDDTNQPGNTTDATACELDQEVRLYL